MPDVTNFPGAFKEVSTAIQKLTVEQIEGFIETGSIEVRNGDCNNCSTRPTLATLSICHT